MYEWLPGTLSTRHTKLPVSGIACQSCSNSAGVTHCAALASSDNGSTASGISGGADAYEHDAEPSGMCDVCKCECKYERACVYVCMYVC